MIESKPLIELVGRAASKRDPVQQDTNAYRLFNGFYEGAPGLVLDRYGPVLVIMNHAEPGIYDPVIDEIARWAIANLQGLEAVLYKQRQHPEEGMKQGQLLAGERLPDAITEYDVSYALNLQLHQDASFYLDTRLLRRWLLDHMAGKRVLNTFAYTGSLGVAAGAGGASSVVQTDINPKYLQIAQQSWTANHLPTSKNQAIPGDFFRVAGRLRADQRLFDCVILDPPFFSSTEAGTIDLLGEATRLVNKVRPLVAHQGWLVVINNALFLPGADFMAELEALCQSPYITFEQTIPVPADITGFPDTITTQPPKDPAPFNHPTKIAILRFTRKDGRQ
jgi:23S rRNA (cytosine1962-C5)-methyltransferase